MPSLRTRLFLNRNRHLFPFCDQENSFITRYNSIRGIDHLDLEGNDYTPIKPIRQCDSCCEYTDQNVTFTVDDIDHTLTIDDGLVLYGGDVQYSYSGGTKVKVEGESKECISVGVIKNDCGPLYIKPYCEIVDCKRIFIQPYCCSNELPDCGENECPIIRIRVDREGNAANGNITETFFSHRGGPGGDQDEGWCNVYFDHPVDVTISFRGFLQTCPERVGFLREFYPDIISPGTGSTWTQTTLDNFNQNDQVGQVRYWGNGNNQDETYFTWRNRQHIRFYIQTCPNLGCGWYIKEVFVKNVLKPIDCSFANCSYSNAIPSISVRPDHRNVTGLYTIQNNVMGAVIQNVGGADGLINSDTLIPGETVYIKYPISELTIDGTGTVLRLIEYIGEFA